MIRVPRISYARSADGVSLAFTVAGDGPALVFVPWVPFSNLRMEWRSPILQPVFERLAQRLTLVHYDGRGTGHSQRDVADLSLDAMVSDLDAVIDRAGLAEVGLLGQYNSCPHAIAYAARRPERVRRMVLFGGSARGWDAMSAKQTQAMLSLIEQDWDLFADTAAHQWLGWSAGEAGRAVADAIRDAVTPQIARATMQAASAADVSELLPRVAARTLVLHPRDMPQIPVGVARSLAMGLPRGRLVMLEGAHLQDITMAVHDVGGPIGFLVATGRPERFRALVISNTFGWPLAGYPAVQRMLRVVGSRAFGAVNDLTNVLARFTASGYGVGRKMSKADRRSFLGPWRSRGSRRTTRQTLAGALRIDPVMAEVERSLRTTLAGLPVLTLFGRKNDPYGWQARFQQIFPRATPAGVAGGHHFPFNDDPDAYSAAISAWWAGKVATGAASS